MQWISSEEKTTTIFSLPGENTYLRGTSELSPNKGARIRPVELGRIESSSCNGIEISGVDLPFPLLLGPGWLEHPSCFLSQETCPGRTIKINTQDFGRPRQQWLTDAGTQRPYTPTLPQVYGFSRWLMERPPQCPLDPPEVTLYDTCTSRLGSFCSPCRHSTPNPCLCIFLSTSFQWSPHAAWLLGCDLGQDLGIVPSYFSAHDFLKKSRS